MRYWFVAIAVAALIGLSACADSTTDDPPPAEASTTTIGQAATSSTVAATMSTTVPPTAAATSTTASTVPDADTATFPISVGESVLAAPDPQRGNGGAAGSGCNPGSSSLPDGIWFGFLREVRASEVVFDLACIFFDDAATTAAISGGGEEPPNGFYIRNENTQLRELEVAPDGAQIHVIVAPPGR